MLCTKLTISVSLITFDNTKFATIHDFIICLSVYLEPVRSTNQAKGNDIMPLKMQGMLETLLTKESVS